MGRTRITKSGRSMPGVRKELQSPVKAGPTIPALLEKTQELLTRCEYELAAKFIERVLSQSPDNSEALEYKGIVEIETGEVEEARKTFLSLISRATPPSSAYLYLAQLCDDDPRQALQHYQAAVDILAGQLKGKEPANNALDSQNFAAFEEETKKTAIRALVSMVEIYMSDLCFEPDAETQCESYLNLALQIDPESPDAFLSLASVRLSQSRPEDAKGLAQRAWQGWQAVAEDITLAPPPASLLSLTRIFLELSLFTESLEVLVVIFSLDDEEVEAWYLQGWCFILMAERVKQTGESLEDLGWAELAQDARDCLETCRALHTAQNYADEELLAHVNELIAELEEAGMHPSTHTEANEEGGSDQAEENEEWYDVDDDDAMEE